MEQIELRKKRGLKNFEFRRSYSCTDLAALLCADEPASQESASGEESDSGDAVCGDTCEGVNGGGVRMGSDASVLGRRIWSNRRKKPSSPVISSPLQPSDFPSKSQSFRKLVLPQHVKSMNFSNPFGTIGRKSRQKGRKPVAPVIVLSKCSGPPPSQLHTSSSVVTALSEQDVYLPLENPFSTFPRRAAQLLGLDYGGTRSSNSDSSLFSSSSIFRVAEEEGGEDSNHLMTSQYRKFLGKSMDKLPTCGAISPSQVGPFRRECGGESRDSEWHTTHPAHTVLENPESETRWYFKYFLGKVHHNYLCYDSDKSPFFLSVVSSGSITRCIVWRSTGCKRLSIRKGSNGKMPSLKSILQKFSVSKYDKNIKEVATEKIQKEFLTMEEQEGAVNFKFGVLYARAGQTTDNEMYGNEHGSSRFAHFLELLGDEVALEGWQHFRGGLDVKNNSTGATSVFTVFEGHEIMFHVSTILPFTRENEQQLERKRHIGNDIVVIIFVDGDDPDAAYQTCLTFDPNCMKSHFNHIFALVCHNRMKNTFRVAIHSAESVPVFGPPLPTCGEFEDHSTFRDFLLTKLINGEKASYCTPTFAEKRNRTLSLLLKDVEHKCTNEYRRALSVPVIKPQPTTPSSHRKYAELEHSFTDYGQRLKVEKIITGHHPTSQRTTVSPKRDPWEPLCIAEEFPHRIIHGDYCDDGTLIVSTENDGTYFLYKVYGCVISSLKHVCFHIINLYIPQGFPRKNCVYISVCFHSVTYQNCKLLNNIMQSRFFSIPKSAMKMFI